MAYMGNLKKGDRVKVTLEGEVQYGSSFGVDLNVGNGLVVIREQSFPGASFEKIEPPVEVFKPGDVVRHKAFGTIRVLGEDGYLMPGTSGAFVRYGLDGYGRENFTSKDFERVDLSALA